MTDKEKANDKRTKKQKFSLEGMKEARESGISRLDQLDKELVENDDVYEVVDEEKYAKIVEDRRNKGDFVVDDDGLGYYDNGEEILGADEDGKRKVGPTGKSHDNSVAKRARKLAEESAGQKGSILKHVQTGIFGGQKAAPKERAPQQLLDIDALLGGGSGGGKVSGVITQPLVNPAYRAPMMSRKPLISMPVMPSLFPTSEPLFQSGGDFYESTAQDYSFESDPMDISPSSTAEVDVKNEVTGEEDEAAAATGATTEEPQDQKISISKSNKKLKMYVPPPNSQHPPASKDEHLLSLLPIQHQSTTSVFSEQDTPQLSQITGENAAGSSGIKVDPKLWLHTTTAEDAQHPNEEYVNMFWMDAVELNGLVYLFGRIPVQEPATAGTATGTTNVTNKRYVSCCVVVHGCERNLFVLPKNVPDQYNADGSPVQVEMPKVYSEINQLLVPSIVPRQQGTSFKCKPVERNYAFEYMDVPRGVSKYLKIVYSAKHGVPSAVQCSGGKFYERIFGSTASALELFILKRKLMGPCWITIRKPKLNPDTVSWCKVEIAIDDPKLITKTVHPEQLGTPPIVSMSISIKTAVNPVTHVHEIVALSGLVHHKVDTEADTDVNPKFMSRFTFVRQLGISCGNAYPSAFPHDLASEVRKHQDMALQTCMNERALLSLFFVKILQEDPDMFVSHNLLGFEFDVILSRAVQNKLPNWSLLGRLRKSKPPKSINDFNAFSGRLLCDTYKAAKEFLRETTYSLTHLAASQLKQERPEVDPIDVPKYFSTAANICTLARHTFRDCFLVQGLMLKLQVVPLTKQLTNLSGNLWSRTIRGARAERIEYLLLHEFHAMKYIMPERKQSELQAKKGSAGKNIGDEENEELDGGGGGGGGTGKVGGTSRKRAKAAYAGGLVLEPKKGLYDSYILLLDFNSLYPSIIQEYNLCFTTINWPKYMPENSAAVTAASAAAAAVKDEKSTGKAKKRVTIDTGGGEENNNSDNDESDSEHEQGTTNDSGNKTLPPLPEASSQPGVLPRVIKTLVDRRKEVKKVLKSERDPAKRQQLDIRQKAIKLTANSMYGCLGFSFSRFYARPIAALVTAMGRQALQRTVDLATNQLALDVIYGDTDSVMINTNLHDLAQVKEIGYRVKREVNKLYKSLELDLDGIFRSMLLLKKKKYAALVVTEHADGTVTYEKEMKGLDLVRRDWCVLSKETGQYVVDQILSGKSCEEIVLQIHDHLADLSKTIREGKLDIEKYVITKGLNKNPKDYPDCSGQAHLQVALHMLKANKPVNIGDHIPYIICTQVYQAPTTTTTSTPSTAASTSNANQQSAAHRAYHPDEVLRRANPLTADGQTPLTIDYEWYLSNQLLPPISRLCEPIEGTSAVILSERLGLDASKYARMTQSNQDDFLEENWGFTPKCQWEDSERFKECTPLTCVCTSCHQTIAVDSVMTVVSGGNPLACSNCHAIFYGRGNARDCYCYLSNRVTLLLRESLKRYYDSWLICDDHSCGRRTMQQSVRGFQCTEDCHGRMIPEYNELQLHTQLQYVESLFDVPRMVSRKQLQVTNNTAVSNGLYQYISKENEEVLNLLKQELSHTVQSSAYNWIRPSLWNALFGKTTSGNSGGVTGGKKG